VDAAFAHELAAENDHLHDELDAATTAIEQQLAADAILPTGELKLEYRQNPLPIVKELAARYETARTRVQAIQANEGHKAEVFNHLVNFFDRYYDEGDFIPKRRYGARPAYAVPYNGEEVFFTWGECYRNRGWGEGCGLWTHSCV
jgi:adenine-specific DNA-methyltransferase